MRLCWRSLLAVMMDGLDVKRIIVLPNILISYACLTMLSFQCYCSSPKDRLEIILHFTLVIYLLRLIRRRFDGLTA